MKRFVTYLYEYEKGTKTRSVGFIKVDIRNGMVNMEICVRKFFKNVENGTVYALVAPNGLYGAELGEIRIYGGQGDMRLQMQDGNIAENEIFVEDMAGIGIHFGERGYIASCWKDVYAQEIGEGLFSSYNNITKNEDNTGGRTQEIVRTELAENEDVADELMEKKLVKAEYTEGEFAGGESLESGRAEVKNAECTLLETKVADQDYVEKAAKDASEMQVAEWGQQLQMSVDDTEEDERSAVEKIEDICGAEVERMIESGGTEKEYIYKKIDLTHTRELPPSDRHYGSNAFLIHGFWNYGYLICKTEMAGNHKTVSLGVPGVYERQEAAMAMAFGFPRFETFPMEMIDEMFLTERKFSEKEINDQSPKARLFGCWFVELHSLV